MYMHIYNIYSIYIPNIYYVYSVYIYIYMPCAPYRYA